MFNKYIIISLSLIFVVTTRAMKNPTCLFSEEDAKYIAMQLIEDAENDRKSAFFDKECLPEEQEMIKKALSRYFSNKLWLALCNDISCKGFNCKDEVSSLSISHDDRFIIMFFRDRSAQILDLQIEDSVYMSTKAISHDNKFCVVVTNNMVEIWNLKSNQLINHLSCHESVNSVAISKDNNFIFTYSSNKIINIWDSKTYELLDSIELHCQVKEAKSKDNKFRASASQGNFYRGTVDVFDLESNESIYSLNCCLTGSVTAVAISSDNNLLVSGDFKRMVNIWDMQKGKLIKTVITGGSEYNINLYYDRYTCAAISNDNTFIATDSYNCARAKIWYLPLDNYTLNEIFEKIRESNRPLLSKLYNLFSEINGSITNFSLKSKQD